MKLIWLICGLISLVLGFIGIAVPLLPTVPFILLAAFCFARSSESLHNWLIAHPTFGPAIQDWRESGSISMRGKLWATGSICAVLLLSVILQLKLKIILIQVVTLSCVMFFIWTRPSAKR